MSMIPGPSVNQMVFGADPQTGAPAAIVVPAAQVPASPALLAAFESKLPKMSVARYALEAGVVAGLVYAGYRFAKMKKRGR